MLTRHRFLALTAVRLLPLDKCPGVRPIGIGEVIRRIIGKAIIAILKPVITASIGTLQLCAGQQNGCEAGILAMSHIFSDDASDWKILLVDATCIQSIE